MVKDAMVVVIAITKRKHLLGKKEIGMKLKKGNRVTATNCGSWGTVIEVFPMKRQRVRVLWDNTDRIESLFADCLYRNGEKRFDGKLIIDPKREALCLEKPVLKNKIITDTSEGDFEDQMDDFIKDLASYSIQFKPVPHGTTILYTALITYQEPEKEEDNVISEANITIH